MSNLQNNLSRPVCYGSREVVDEEARLPKTMVHWFREFGVTFDPAGGTGYAVRKELKIGCGSPVRRFRALPHLGLLQICDGFFDRWANSVGAETALPKSRSEFVVAMGILLESAKLYKVDAEEQIASLEEQLSSVETEIDEVRSENRDLEAHVRYFGLSDRLIRRLWKRYQWQISYLRSKRGRIKSELKFQQLRHSEVEKSI
jgi:hypothetical protein